MLTGLNGTIKCDNTLDTRAQLAIRDLQPVVRYLLFPSCRSKPVEKPAMYARVIEWPLALSLGVLSFASLTVWLTLLFRLSVMCVLCDLLAAPSPARTTISVC